VIVVAGFRHRLYNPLPRPPPPPDRTCQLFVDVAPGQSLTVTYDYDGAQKTTKQIVCDRAVTAARLAVATLTRQAGR